MRYYVGPIWCSRRPGGGGVGWSEIWLLVRLLGCSSVYLLCFEVHLLLGEVRSCCWRLPKRLVLALCCCFLHWCCLLPFWLWGEIIGGRPETADPDISPTIACRGSIGRILGLSLWGLQCALWLKPGYTHCNIRL